MEIPEIIKIYISDSFGQYYTYEKYVNDLKIIKSGENIILNNEEKRRRFNQKITILTSIKNYRINFLRGYFFSDAKDWQVFEVIAILEYYRPKVCFIYYKVGEKYGETDDTIVQEENTLIKEFYIYHNYENILMKTYYDNILSIINQEELSKIVKIFFNVRISD